MSKLGKSLLYAVDLRGIGGNRVSGSMRGELNQVTLRSLILASICFAIWGTGVTLGCRPNPPEGDSPSDSLLRFAAV